MLVSPFIVNESNENQKKKLGPPKSCVSKA